MDMIHQRNLKRDGIVRKSQCNGNINSNANSIVDIVEQRCVCTGVYQR